MFQSQSIWRELRQGLKQSSWGQKLLQKARESAVSRLASHGLFSLLSSSI